LKKETSVGMSLAVGALACAICLAYPSFSKAQAVTGDVQNLVKAPSSKDLHPSTDKTPKREAVGEEAHPEVAALPDGIDLKTYRIGIEDDLMISVWREPELSNQVVVRPDGKITMPLLNDIQVAGMRTEELQNLLTEKLKPFVNSPQVTVIVRGIRSRKVYLVGNVGHQGTFTLNDEKTVLELIAEAGGLGPFAKSGSIYILREAGGGKKVRIGFDYKKAIAGTGPNPVLQPGDLVVVR
jgi:polysaccharide export outer membrane protein